MGNMIINKNGTFASSQKIRPAKFISCLNLKCLTVLGIDISAQISNNSAFFVLKSRNCILNFVTSIKVVYQFMPDDSFIIMEIISRET